MVKNKKASHVGVILSFVIFITFIIFLYSIIQPLTKVQRGKQDLVKYLKTELINKFKDNFTTESVALEESVNENCIKINALQREGIVVKNNENKQILNSFLDLNKVVIERDNAKELKIYYAKEFSKGEIISGCSELSEEEYTLGLVKTTKEVFLQKVINLTEFINESESNYNEVKKELKIPPGSEFSFIFKGGNREELAKTKQENVSVNVYAEEIPVQYVDNEANINPGFIEIKVW